MLGESCDRVFLGASWWYSAQQRRVGQEGECVCVCVCACAVLDKAEPGNGCGVCVCVCVCATQELSSILSLVPHPATGLQKVTYDTDFNTTLAAVTELEKKREKKQQEKREKGGGKRGRGKGDAGGEDSDADMSDEGG